MFAVRLRASRGIQCTSHASVPPSHGSCSNQTEASADVEVWHVRSAKGREMRAKRTELHGASALSKSRAFRAAMCATLSSAFLSSSSNTLELEPGRRSANNIVNSFTSHCLGCACKQDSSCKQDSVIHLLCRSQRWSVAVECLIVGNCEDPRSRYMFATCMVNCASKDSSLQQQAL